MFKKFLFLARPAFAGGNTASLLSLLMLLHRCRRDGHPLCRGINAISHWVWGERALLQVGTSWRYTVLGMGIHHISSLFWAVFFAAITAPRKLQSSAATPAVGEATMPDKAPATARALSVKTLVARAAATTALAWVVDYHLIPKRLTPGFERVISCRSRVWVYAAFATGLAAAALHSQGRSIAQNKRIT